jgi:hypothetical protein
MQIERLTVESSSEPFPIYADPIGHLLRAHVGDMADRDAAVAHVLAVLSGYAYSDTATVAMMAGRLGMAGSACVRIAQAVDAMTIFSTAYLLQSRCGRVVVLCYRGTEAANLGNWLGDADVGSHTIGVGGGRLTVHSGFDRNVSATRWPILELLQAAARGESIARPGARVDHPLEALYLAGHSLGGAMAVLFALRLVGSEDDRGLDDRLRAIYTFGQPLTTGGPLPESALAVARRLFRHVHARDVVPSLPPAAWGALEHFGHEFHYANGAWRRRDPAAQLSNFRDVSRSVLSMFAPVKRRDGAAYTIADHGPHHYIAALRPAGRVTEFGDRLRA